MHENDHNGYAPVPLFLSRLVTRLGDLERIRANRLMDLLRYYSSCGSLVCPRCLREFRGSRQCTRCGLPLVSASQIATSVIRAGAAA